MKKAITLLNLVALLSVCAVFSSCNDSDTDEAMVLSGQWRGDWGMYYEIEDPWGNWVTFDSYDTDIVFYPDYDYATHGYGYKLDWYDYGPYERLSYRFSWSINNGIISLRYPDDYHYDVDIYNYRLNNNYFYGSFQAGGSQFTLRKIADYYDWGYYSSWSYHYWAYDSWSWYSYYAKTRGNAAETDSTNAPSKEARIVRIGSRLAE